MELGVFQEELGELVRFYVVEGHKATVDRQTLYLVLENELGEIL